MIGNRALSQRIPIRPRSTHPPVGPFRCGRRGAPALVPPYSDLRLIITEMERLLSKRRFFFYCYDTKIL